MAVSPHSRLVSTSITSQWIMLKDVSSLNYPAQFNVVLTYFVVTYITTATQSVPNVGSSACTARVRENIK